MLMSSILTSLDLADAGIVALLGYGVVFFGLILLMGVVSTLGSFFSSKNNKGGKA